MPDMDDFLTELAELCAQYGIGILDGAQLYTMEFEDYAHSYKVDDDSRLYRE